jgi:hypothetical protein
VSVKRIPIRVSEHMLDALAKIAEHEVVSIDAAAHALLYRALQQKREEWLAAHPSSDVTTLDVPVDVCSEEHLRRICGDQWEICWWAGGCWALPG